MKKRITRKLTGIILAAVLTGTMLFTVPVNAGSVQGQIGDDCTSGWCTHYSHDVEASTLYIPQRDKEVTLYAYAAYGTNYFFYNSAYTSSYHYYDANVNVGISDPFTAIGGKAIHKAKGANNYVWTDTSYSGYYE